MVLPAAARAQGFGRGAQQGPKVCHMLAWSSACGVDRRSELGNDPAELIRCGQRDPHHSIQLRHGRADATTPRQCELLGHIMLRTKVPVKGRSGHRTNTGSTNRLWDRRGPRVRTKREAPRLHLMRRGHRNKSDPF